MSARLAVSTGNPQWKNRYVHHKTLLNDAIEEAKLIFPDHTNRRGAEQTAQANVALISMEERAFKLIEDGQKDQAMALLMSEEYAQKKKVYARGMTTFSEGLQNVVQASIEGEKRNALFNVGISLAIFLILVFIWVRGYFFLSSVEKTTIPAIRAT